MHERSIVEELVDQAAAMAKEQGIGWITGIRVSLGEESHVTEEALRFWFDLIKGGTIAEQAVLEVNIGKGNEIVMTSLEGEAPDAYRSSS